MPSQPISRGAFIQKKLIYPNVNCNSKRLLTLRRNLMSQLKRELSQSIPRELVNFNARPDSAPVIQGWNVGLVRTALAAKAV